MARPTKAPKFTIYEDAGIPTPDSACERSFDDALLARARGKGPEDVYNEEDEDDHGLGGLDELEEENIDARTLADLEIHEEGDSADVDDECRRASAITSTTISSFPESTFDIDHGRSMPMHQPYSPPLIRPSFRRPSSVRRMQMSSPTPFDRSPRRSVLHHSRSRPGTPRSVQSSVKGSSKSRRTFRLEDDETGEEDERDYPLVLLHVTLLPVEMRWSPSVMRQLLPPRAMENLELLHSKVSETIAQRGILIQHPQAEYDLLEERLLQALELRKERLTKCGHFRARDSLNSILSSESSARDSDSGVGSDVETCETCHQHVKADHAGVAGEKLWTVKVFAANGLLGASAWAAAWSDMERVDVEISPWIDTSLSRALDAKQQEEDAADMLAEEQEEARIKAIVEEQVRIAHDEMKRLGPASARPEHEHYDARELSDEHHHGRTDMVSSSPRYVAGEATSKPRRRKSSLPQVFRPRDIPLSVLLRNYFFLLAQDQKNIAIIVLVLIALWLGLRPTGRVPPAKLTVVAAPLDMHPSYEANLIPPVAVANATIETVLTSSELVNKPTDVASPPALDAVELPVTEKTSDLIDDSTPSVESELAASSKIEDASDAPAEIKTDDAVSEAISI